MNTTDMQLRNASSLYKRIAISTVIFDVIFKRNGSIAYARAMIEGH